jgi:tripartite-type tricarboxylate transporter receptor subunit TctC
VKRIIMALFLAPFGALWCASAHAQSYPQKTIRLIVPSAAGSAPDIIGRVICP